MKTLLITGSGAFIGKNLKEYFKNKYNLLTPRSFELDCTDTKAVEEYFKQNKIDLIIHCGTVGGVRGVVDSDTTVVENLRMVDNLLQFKQQNVRMILFGSGAMYDKSRPIVKAKECSIGDFIPQDLYGKSKMLIAQKVQDRADCVCLNIFGCYGRWEKDSRFPTYAITQVLKNEPIIINQNVVFDYLYIDDLVKIIEFFLQQQPTKNIINVTPTDSISLKEIAEIVKEISNSNTEIIIKADSMGNEYTGDNTLLFKEYPTFEFTSYKAGLTKLYEYLKQSYQTKGTMNAPL